MGKKIDGTEGAITDLTDAQLHKSLSASLPKTEKFVTVTFNSDGVALFKSSKIEFGRVSRY